MLVSALLLSPALVADASPLALGAVRMAVEIGLQRPVRRLEPNDPGEPLIRDAQRCWMTLWLADASWAAQTGRASLIALDSKVQQPPEWLESAVSQRCVLPLKR